MYGKMIWQVLENVAKSGKHAFSYIDKHGKRQYIQKSGFSSKKMAQEYANKIGMDLAEQHDVANRDDTLIDFFYAGTKYLENHE